MNTLGSLYTGTVRPSLVLWYNLCGIVQEEHSKRGNLGIRIGINKVHVNKLLHGSRGIRLNKNLTPDVLTYDLFVIRMQCEHFCK